MILLDQYCTDSPAEVVEPYDCTLNQTDLKTNKNKFYIMQIIKTSQAYFLYTRYGRIGETGKIAYITGTENTCITKFVSQFRSKTKNEWASRDNFRQYADKYYLCQKQQVKDTDINVDATTKSVIQQSKLDERVQSFLRLVGDVKMLQNTLKSLNIDTQKMPLGAISTEQLKKAEDVLIEIKKLITTVTDPNDLAFKEKCLDLSSKYYTYVPQVVSRSNVPELIATQELIDGYLNRIEDLRNLKIAYTAITPDVSIDSTENPIDKLYQSIKTEIEPLPKDSKMWSVIENYVNNTQGVTHHVKVELLDIYEICRDDEKNRVFSIDNIHLLWHGTRLSNYISILKNGLVLRPELISNAKITGKMFSNGIYAANSFSKSFNYCTSESGQDACLFLGEFALGNQLKKTQANYTITEKSIFSSNHHSCWGQGKWTPSTTVEIDNIKIPNGKLVQSAVKNASLLYDEFIVYREDQLKLRYIVRVKHL